MADIRQSQEYAKFIKSLNWQVEKIGKWNIFIKKFPLIGSLIKIQRIEPPIPFEEIEKLAKKYHAFQIILEPASTPPSPSRLADEADGARRGGPAVPQLPQTPQIPYGYKPLKSPFIPTKTLILDLSHSEQEIFNSFSKNKRRDIRIAERNNLAIEEGSPEQFYELKKKFLLKRHILPIGTKNEIFPLYHAFGKNAKVLLAYPPNLPNTPKTPNLPLAGLLLLFHDKTAYYWQAASTKQGNKLLAPTLLLWEAIKLAKKKGCTKFDFEGVYDERFPQNQSWLGFTHFKQGFGGKEIVFPLPITKIKYPFNLFW